MNAGIHPLFHNISAHTYVPLLLPHLKGFAGKEHDMNRIITIGREFGSGGDHRAVLPAQKQRKPEKTRGGQAHPTRTGGEKPMKKRILSILLLCCMVLTLLPTTAFAAGELRRDKQF